MSWGRVDDGWHRHPKIRRCSMAARGLWTTAFSWTADVELDGFIPEDMVPKLAETDDVAAMIEQLTRIAPPYTHGLWEKVDGGYVMHDYLKINPSAKSLDRKRKKHAKHSRTWRERDRSRNDQSSISGRTPGSGRVGTGSSCSSSRSSSGGKRKVRKERGGLLALFGPPDFDAFWSAYPKRVAKQDAQKAWDALHPDAALTEQILAAVAAQRRWPQWTRNAGQYVPNPATWLNHRRWTDEPPAPSTTLLTDKTSGNLAAAEAFLRRTP